jgi:hypothetical protein
MATDKATQIALGIDGKNATVQRSSAAPQQDNLPIWKLVIIVVLGTSVSALGEVLVKRFFPRRRRGVS